jgi:hypothetical protein
MSSPVRYFFHLVSDYEVIPDEGGVDLWNDEDTLFHIIEALGEFIKDDRSNEWQGWCIEVADGTGQTVLSVPLIDFDQRRSLLH